MLLEAVLVVGRGQIVSNARCCVRESSVALSTEPAAPAVQKVNATGA